MNKKNHTLMTSIVAAMAVEATPFLMTTPAQHAGLLKDGLVEINGEMKDGDKVATRATEKGIAALNEQNNASNASAQTFEIDTDVPMPSTRGGRSSVAYPFEKLEVNQSFHIPATTEKPNPAKSIASTVSAASKSFATDTGKTKTTPKGNTVPVLEFTRKFSVKAVDASDPKGAGARVWRTA